MTTVSLRSTSASLGPDRVRQPRHSRFRRDQCVRQRPEGLFGVKANRKPTTAVFGITPMLFKAKCSVRTQEDIDATQLALLIDRVKDFVLGHRQLVSGHHAPPTSRQPRRERAHRAAILAYRRRVRGLPRLRLAKNHSSRSSLPLRVLDVAQALGDAAGVGTGYSWIIRRAQRSCESAHCAKRHIRMASVAVIANVLVTALAVEPDIMPMVPIVICLIAENGAADCKEQCRRAGNLLPSPHIKKPHRSCDR